MQSLNCQKNNWGMGEKFKTQFLVVLRKICDTYVFLFRQQQIIDHFCNTAALFIIWVFSWMHTVCKLSAFEGLKLTPWGNTGTTVWGMEPKTVGVQPHNPDGNSNTAIKAATCINIRAGGCGWPLSFCRWWRFSTRLTTVCNCTWKRVLGLSTAALRLRVFRRSPSATSTNSGRRRFFLVQRIRVRSPLYWALMGYVSLSGNHAQPLEMIRNIIHILNMNQSQSVCQSVSQSINLSIYLSILGF